jgi:hypothetical protein
MKNLRNPSLVLVLCAMASPAALAETDNHRLDDAWKAALMDQEGVITQQQHATINSIAYHAAAARLCDGLDLDTDKVATAMNAIATPADAAMEDEHVLERLTHIVMTLGVAKGLFIAEGSLKKTEFCADAMSSKTEEGNEHFFK